MCKKLFPQNFQNSYFKEHLQNTFYPFVTKGQTYLSKPSTKASQVCYALLVLPGLSTCEYSTGFCFAYIRKSLLEQLFFKFWPSSQKNICNTAHFQHSCKPLLSYKKMHCFSSERTFEAQLIQYAKTCPKSPKLCSNKITQ